MELMLMALRYQRLNLRSAGKSPTSRPHFSQSAREAGTPEKWGTRTRGVSFVRSFGLMLIALCLALMPTASAEEWSKTYKVAGKPALKVETTDANIEVDTWEQNTIEARVTTSRWKIGEEGLKIEEHQSGDEVSLEVRYPHRSIDFSIGTKPRGVDIVIHMPREGRVDLDTTDGNIHLSNFKGAMQINSSDGGQDLDSVSGTLKSHAGDGHIRASGQFTLLDLTSGNGKIEIRVEPGSSVAEHWNLRAGEGSIKLDLPAELAADLRLHTNSGHIRVDVPMTSDEKKKGKDIRGKMNGGGNTVTVRTGEGSILLEKV